VKPDVDTLPTVPDDPPAAGPDRALDQAPDLGPPTEPPPVAVVEVLLAVVVDADVVVGEDEPQPASPITPHVNAAAMIRRLLPLDSNLVPPLSPSSSAVMSSMLTTRRSGFTPSTRSREC
jgi:hypothetical protein